MEKDYSVKSVQENCKELILHLSLLKEELITHSSIVQVQIILCKDLKERNYSYLEEHSNLISRGEVLLEVHIHMIFIRILRSV
jgi:hypothetical protein